jgi:DNA polymerase III gamma/tau subunit
MNVFLAVTFTPTEIGLAVLAVIAGAWAFGVFEKVDDKLIKARKTAQNVASFCNQTGLPDVADFFEDFAVDDIPGMLQAAEFIVKTMDDPQKRTLALLKVVQTFILACQAAGDTATLTELQNMLANPSQAAQIAAQPLSAAALQQLVSALNPNQIQTGATQQTKVISQPGTINVAPPAVQTIIQHTLVPSAAAVAGGTATPAA